MILASSTCLRLNLHRTADLAACLSGLLFMTLTPVPAWADSADDLYLLGPDSQPHAGVPQGKIVGPLTLASEVFTNTTRHYWVYVPAQYDPAKAACLMIFQDGHQGVWLAGS